jgi:hypothetical protein
LVATFFSGSGAKSATSLPLSQTLAATPPRNPIAAVRGVRVCSLREK